MDSIGIEGFSFINESTVENLHVNTNGNQQKEWTCSTCGKIFRYPYTLLRHMPIHSQERKYKCEKCPKAFRQMSTLSQHKATHSSAKPYSCDICGKAFNRGSTLISHRRTHQEVKRFACSICHKAFHQKGNLVNHIYTHTNERPYRCNICLKGFNQKSNLVCHMYSLHGRKKFHSCNYCPASFSRENAYRAHLNACHRLGTMPIVENDFPSTLIAETEVFPDDNLEAQENKFSLKQEINDQNLVLSSISSSHQNDYFKSNIRVNVLKTPKEPLLKIPALPLFSDITNIIGKKVDLVSNVKDNEDIDLTNLNKPMCQSVVADIITSDMGQNLFVWEKPPLVLEEARDKGEVPYILVTEPGQPSKLCKASLGTEGFLVSLITNFDVDMLASNEKKVKISIVMTIKRLLTDSEKLKTFIFVHQPPVQLNVLPLRKDHINCKPLKDAKFKTTTIPLEVLANLNEDSLCIKLNNDKDSIKIGEVINPISKNNDFHKHNEHVDIDDKFTTFQDYIESENMIRLHLSKVGSEDSFKLQQAKVEFQKNV